MCAVKVTRNWTVSKVSFWLKCKMFGQLAVLPLSGKIKRPSVLGPLDKSWSWD